MRVVSDLMMVNWCWQFAGAAMAILAEGEMFDWAGDRAGWNASQKMYQGDVQICNLEQRLTRGCVVRHESQVARAVRSTPRVYVYLSRG